MTSAWLTSALALPSTGAQLQGSFDRDSALGTPTASRFSPYPSRAPRCRQTAYDHS